MSKRKRKVSGNQSKKKDDVTLTLSDSLDEDILEKLKAAKTKLADIESEKEAKRQEQLRHERKEREKNKSFEELLTEYGDIGSKY